ncbi:MAG: YceH family protein [Leptospirillia bacterium]
MDIKLSDAEARVLGCLIEKEVTTPDYYPMTLNALTNACNQKSNRNPVVAYEQTTVVRALDRLQTARLTVTTHQAGSHTPKYRHVITDRIPLAPAELAVLCELLLRGPQTVGELRGRAARMHDLGDLAATQVVLDGLMERQPPLLTELPRQPGRKECRYAHLLCGEVDVSAIVSAAGPSPEAATVQVRAEDERIARLETQVATLSNELAALKKNLENFMSQF